jgi:methylenetetrahydrofolate dehydrogenase (NADP+)/methenyltetrahydrofolate cyclohydrolase
MSAKILDGTSIASDIRREVASEVKAMAAAGVRPGLAVVLVGHNPASEVYVRGKVKACEEVGIYSEQHAPSEDISTAVLLELIHDLNRRDEIDGILIQLPLPPQVDSKKVLFAVDPAKDVDGFHPVNVGFLSTQRPGLVPCTPAGVIEILRRSQIVIAGQEAVVVGRSDIVGKTCGHAVDQCQRHRNRLSFQDARSIRRMPPRRYFDRRNRTCWNDQT